MASHTYTGTVTFTTNYPEAPRGVSVAATSFDIAAKRAVRAALAKRKKDGVKTRVTAFCVKLTRGAPLAPRETWPR